MPRLGFRMPESVSTVLRCLSDIDTTFQPPPSFIAPTQLCYIQNATLLTFMPPFILIYMYRFEHILISQLHPYEKYREKGKTLTEQAYLNNSWRKEKCNRKKRYLFVKFGKISALRICFTDVEFHEQNVPFEAMLSNITTFLFFNFTVSMKRSEYIYTTLTLHKYRNNNYCT